jgi:hypothetical protein
MHRRFFRAASQSHADNGNKLGDACIQKRACRLSLQQGAFVMTPMLSSIPTATALSRVSVVLSPLARPPSRRTLMLISACLLAASTALVGSVVSAWAQGAPQSWPILPETFESTGGGGWMITQYRPAVDGAVCKTDFVAVSPDGKERFPNEVEWTAIPRDGGTYCAAGKWRAKDGSASGTTPLEVFIKDGVVRRAPT